MRLALPEGFKPLQIPPSAVRKLSDEEVADRQPLKPLPPADLIADNHPSNIYATLERNGQTIATIYKSGGMMTSNAVSLPSNLSNEGTGLPLAEQRLQQMLELHGGTVNYVRPAATPLPPERASSLFAAQLGAMKDRIAARG